MYVIIGIVLIFLYIIGTALMSFKEDDKICEFVEGIKLKITYLKILNIFKLMLLIPIAIIATPILPIIFLFKAIIWLFKKEF